MVEGGLTGPGSMSADRVILTGEYYIPGDTEVLVTGMPSSVHYGLGTATIGSLAVDYTASLSGSRFGGIGAAIAVTGVQPASGGLMISDRVIDKTDLFMGR
jgi:hypothetical protein